MHLSSARPIAVDTNILLVAQGAGDGARRRQARVGLGGVPLSLPAQVLREFHCVLRHQVEFDAASALEVATRCTSIDATLDTTRSAFDGAMELCADHQIDTSDARIRAALLP